MITKEMDDKNLYDYFNYWLTNSVCEEIAKNPVVFTYTKLSKPFPYKHKTKRLMKKWIKKKHSEIVEVYLKDIRTEYNWLKE